VFKTSFERANLTFRVVPKLAGMAEDGEEPLALLRLRNYCASKGDGAAGIVYCLSRDESEQVAAHLRDWGHLAAAHYHAGMTHKQRQQVRGGLLGPAVHKAGHLQRVLVVPWVSVQLQAACLLRHPPTLLHPYTSCLMSHARCGWHL